MKQWLTTSILLLLAATSCSSPIQKRNDYIVAYQCGNFTYTEDTITAVIKKEMPNEEYRSSNDSVWLLLDRATARFAKGDTAGAVSDYKLALEAIDFYNQACLQEIIGKVMLQDEIGAYPGDDFEQIFARLYFALALIDQGDLSNATAILRQTEQVQQEKREFYRKSNLIEEYVLTDNSLAKFLLATVLEKRGDFSNAEILYRDAKQLVGDETFSHAIIKNDQSISSQDCATVLVICHNGNVPFKISRVSDASLASAFALELFLAGTDITSPALSSLPGIPTPALADWTDSFPLPTFLMMDGCRYEMVPWYHVALAADQELSQKMPMIVARGVARFLIRRSFVGAVAERNQDAAIFADLAMFAANLATKADTRSWAALPHRIDIARFDMAPGKHAIQLSTGMYPLKLKEGDLCVINVFNLHPGMTRTIIPTRFIQ